MNSISVSQIRLIMEYKSFPVWLCDEDGLKISEGIVEELQDDTWLIQELAEVQNIYDGLFVDNETEFSFRGFSSVEEEADFYVRLQTLAQYICKHVGKKYLIRNCFENGRQGDGFQETGGETGGRFPRPHPVKRQQKTKPSSSLYCKEHLCRRDR